MSAVPVKVKKVEDKTGYGVEVLYDILDKNGNIDEIDYSWNADETLNTKVYKKSGGTVLTLTYTWNADGTLQKVVRT